MRITLIKYGKTVNTGDYNSERLDAELELGEKDCPMAAMEKLKGFINTGEYLSEAAPAKKEVKTTTEAKVDADMTLPETVKEAPEDKTAVKTNKKVAKKAAKKTTKKALVPKADILYSRDEKTHKDDMSKILTKEFPTWKKDHLDKAKGLSTLLVGTPIYNHKGVLLESFTEAIIEGMTASDDDL